MPLHLFKEFDEASQRSGSVYQLVPSLDEAVAETTIPSGETWHVERFIANAAYVDDTTSALYWDRGGGSEAILAAAHGDAEIDVNVDLVGDGSKKLSIVLTNDTATSRVLGGRWEGGKHGS